MDVAIVNQILYTKGRNRSYCKLSLDMYMPMYAKPTYIIIAPPIVTPSGADTQTHTTHTITHTNFADKSNFKKPGAAPNNIVCIAMWSLEIYYVIVGFLFILCSTMEGPCSFYQCIVLFNSVLFASLEWMYMIQCLAFRYCKISICICLFLHITIKYLGTLIM